MSGSADEWQELFDQHKVVLDKHIAFVATVKKYTPDDKQGSNILQTCLAQAEIMSKVFRETSRKFRDGPAPPTTNGYSAPPPAPTMNGQTAPPATKPKTAEKSKKSKKTETSDDTSSDDDSSSEEGSDSEEESPADSAPSNVDPSGLFMTDTNPTPVDTLMQDSDTKPKREKRKLSEVDVADEATILQLPKKKKRNREELILEHRERRYAKKHGPVKKNWPRSYQQMMAVKANDLEKEGKSTEGMYVPVNKDNFIQQVEAKLRKKEEKHARRADKKRKRESEGTFEGTHHKSPLSKRAQKRRKVDKWGNPTTAGTSANAEPVGDKQSSKRSSTGSDGQDTEMKDAETERPRKRVKSEA